MLGVIQISADAIFANFGPPPPPLLSKSNNSLIKLQKNFYIIVPNDSCLIQYKGNILFLFSQHVYEIFHKYSEIISVMSSYQITFLRSKQTIQTGIQDERNFLVIWKHVGASYRVGQKSAEVRRHSYTSKRSLRAEKRPFFLGIA